MGAFSRRLDTRPRHLSWGDIHVTLYFFAVFSALILSELAKGLSANGTPPILQRFAWQMDLAYFMWSHIQKIRIILIITLLYLATQLQITNTITFTAGLIVCAALWGGIYWLFNKYWIGKYKFLPITTKLFLNADDNQLDLALPVIGVDINGEQKAYPANLLFYHHVLSDKVGGQPILATYCGMCRSGRVYDIDWAEGMPEFQLVGAVSYNAVLRDSITNSWWRQETGEAAKGLRQGDQLEDIYFEQMSLGNWLKKHPKSLVLQYDPLFEGKYNFFAKLLNYEADLPGWHFQKTPPLVVGIEIDGQAKGYDLNSLQAKGLVNDEVAGTSVLAVGDKENNSSFVYDRTCDGQIYHFQAKEGMMIDEETNSQWDHLGRCVKGELKGKQLKQIQSYQQFVRAWIIFHPHTDFYKF